MNASILALPGTVNNNFENENHSQWWLNLPPGEKVDRWRFAFSQKFRDKENLGTDEISRGMAFSRGFVDVTGTISDLMAYIEKGYAFCASLLGGDSRKKANYKGSQMVVLDIDNSVPKRDENGLPVKGEKEYSQQMLLEEALTHPLIKNHAALIYTTPSHKEDWHKFRIVFLLPQELSAKDRLLHEEMTRLLLEVIPGDEACKDSSRIFYGSTRGDFRLINAKASLPTEFVDLAVARLEEKKALGEKTNKNSRTYRVARDTYNLPTTSNFTQQLMILEALKYIHPDEPYEDWLRVGMALHSAEDVMPEAMNVWLDWAKQGLSYDHRTSRGSIEYRWKGFDQANHTVSIGSLFWLAEKGGWTKEARKKFWHTCQRRARVQEPSRVRSKYLNELQAVFELVPSQVNWPEKLEADQLNPDCLFKRYLDPTRQRFVNEHTFILSEKYSVVQQRWEDALPDGTGRQFSDRKTSYLIKGKTDRDIQVLDPTVWGSSVIANMPPYRLKEAISHSDRTGSNVVLLVEGVHVAESISRNLGIPAIGVAQGRDAIKLLSDATRLTGMTGIYIPSRKGSKDSVHLDNRIKWIEKEFIRCGGFALVLPHITSEDLLKAIHYVKLGQGLVMDIQDEFAPDADEPIGFPSDHPLEKANSCEEVLEAVVQETEKQMDETRTRLEENLKVGMTANHPENKIKMMDYLMELSDQVANELAWDSQLKRWMGYSFGTIGVWAPVSPETVIREVVMPFYRDKGITPGIGFYPQAEKALKPFLERPFNEGDPSLIPFTNGVLDQNTNVFKPHEPGDNLTWQLPYDYEPLAGRTRSDLIHDCYPIWQWLHEAVGGQPDDIQIVHLLVGYLAAIVRGMTSLQRYMVCWGAPGSGKGTFLRLASALVGKKNVASTTLAALETSKFELAKLVQARLILISEMQTFMGTPLTLKALTGEDATQVERKGQQQELGDDQQARGLVLMAGERIPTTTDTGGIARRQIAVQFTKVPKASERRDLISTATDGVRLRGDFAQYMPAFFQLVMSYTEQEIRELVLETDTYVPRLRKQKAESLLASSSLLQWVEDSLYYSDEIDENTGKCMEYSKVGMLKYDRETDTYLHEHQWLFANYRSWCKGAGLTKPLSLNSFRSELVAAMNNQLNLRVQFSKSQGSAIYGLGIRSGEKDVNEKRIVSELYLDRMDENPSDINLKWNWIDLPSLDPRGCFEDSTTHDQSIPESGSSYGPDDLLIPNGISSLEERQINICTLGIAANVSGEKSDLALEDPSDHSQSHFQQSGIESQSELSKTEVSQTKPGEGLPTVQKSADQPKKGEKGRVTDWYSSKSQQSINQNNKEFRQDE